MITNNYPFIADIEKMLSHGGHPEFKQQQIAITLLVCKVTLAEI